MFTTLRSRLWLTYLLVIGLVLAVVTLALLVFLVRNPRLAREAESNLLLAASAIQRQRINLNSLSELDDLVQRADELLNVRVVIFNFEGEVLADSRAETEAAVPMLTHSPQREIPVEISDFTDVNGKVWLYAHRGLPGRYTFLVATPRPSAPILAVFSDEFFRPIAQAGLLALLLSLFLSFLIARWIATPLQDISSAARRVAEGQSSRIDPRGPREVQALSRTFNQMSLQLQAGRQAQRDFVANVSHELKTPLTSVQGFAQAILEGAVKTDDELHQAAGVIHSEAGRMHRLVDDLLELARLDSGTARIQHESLDLANLINGIAERFVPQARSKGVELKTQFNGLPMLTGDPDRLTQVFNNLVDNALQHTPKGGQVRVEVQPINAFLEIAVIDTGEGLSPPDAARIFERFYQVDESRRAGPQRGVGLGLPIAQQIVRAHGGDIRVESQLGKGSRFIVRLPISPSLDRTRST